jgi:hypothetical protein
MVIPTREALIQEFGDDKGVKLYDVLKSKTQPEDYPKTAAWIRACYHEPRPEEKKLRACDEILETYGTEAIESSVYQVDRFHHKIVAVYCNTGDSYAATILFETERERFVITSWGDWVESSPRKYKLNDTEGE